MKKLLILIFIIMLFPQVAFSDDDVSMPSGDLWDNYGDSNFYGQKAVSDQDFDKALESKKVKKNFFGKKKKTQQEKNMPKGQEVRQSNETNYINKVENEYPVILIPVELIVDEKTTVPIGHYQVRGEQEGDKTYIDLYQAHTCIAKIPAYATNDDFGQQNINFANWKEYDSNRIEIDYGSLEINAYAVVNINKNTQDNN